MKYVHTECLEQYLRISGVVACTTCKKEFDHPIAKQRYVCNAVVKILAVMWMLLFVPWIAAVVISTILRKMVFVLSSIFFGVMFVILPMAITFIIFMCKIENSDDDDIEDTNP